MTDYGIGLYSALTALAGLFLYRLAIRRKVNHPPSPTSLPLLGNLLAMPSGQEHLAYLKLGKELKSQHLRVAQFSVARS